MRQRLLVTLALIVVHSICKVRHVGLNHTPHKSTWMCTNRRSSCTGISVPCNSSTILTIDYYLKLEYFFRNNGYSDLDLILIGLDKLVAELNFRKKAKSAHEIFKTRMHSSRMRTARFNGHLGGRGWGCGHWGVQGGVYPRVCSGGSFCRGGMSAQGGICPGGVQTPTLPNCMPGYTIPLLIACWDTYSTPNACWNTHTHP